MYTVHGKLLYNNLLRILVERKWSCTFFKNYLLSLYRCTEECPVGFYGEFCSKECKCENGGTCDHVTGTCRCVPGFVGPTCAIRGQYELSWRKSLPKIIIHLPIKKNVFTLHDYQNYNSDVLSLSDGHFVSLSSTACDDWKYGDNCNIPCQCNTTYADRWGYEISEKSKRIVFILQSFEEKVPCLFTCITFNGSCALN